MDHRYETHKDCDVVGCYICDGGLAFCTVCRCGECELTTDCPGGRITEEARKAICDGWIDFMLGVWFVHDIPVLKMNPRIDK